MFQCTEHSVGQVTAEEMTLYMKRNPESLTDRQSKEHSRKHRAATGMIRGPGARAAAPSDVSK